MPVQPASSLRAASRRSPDPANPAAERPLSGFRLRKHAEYQRVYREGRKQFSSSMTYFYAPRGEAGAEGGARLSGPRVGLTAGRVLGKAVERNRIKRRMREAVRRNLDALTGDVDVVLHPRKSVLTAEFVNLSAEVRKIFTGIEKAAGARSGGR